MRLLSRMAWSIGLAMLLLTTAAQAAEVGFLEDFSLASDRAAVLKQLIPGSEEYYYFHCLHYQNTEQFAKVEEMLPAWTQRHGLTPRLRETLHRQAVLTYEQHPEKSLAYLRDTLGLQFNHEQTIPGTKSNLPVKLDGQQISREALLAREYGQHGQLEGVEDAALQWLIDTDLTPERRRNLLSRLWRPDHAKLVKLIVADLQFANSGGFGSLNIHRQLLLSQLEELLELRPALLNETNFVNAYIAKLQPTADEDWRHDAKALEQYLERLQKFVDRLSPVHNSLKAHVLYHRLQLDRLRGKYDKAKFLAYLELPRSVGYVNPIWLEAPVRRDHRADVNVDFTAVTLLPPIGNDEPLVRDYLQHFFVEAADYKEFEPYILDTYLKHLFAETKIVNGLGNAEQWYSLLPPELYQQLKERVDLEFSPANRTQFDVDDPVSLDVDIKNVTTLLVKVFEINTYNYYRVKQAEIDTAVNLDGLVANQEFTFSYEKSPLRRTRRHFDFPALNKSGVYVIDFIANGKSSRALIRKGKLHFVEHPSSAGHLFEILDSNNAPAEKPSIVYGGQRYQAGQDGRVLVPFSSQPGLQKLILCSGDFCSLAEFQHRAESYSLSASLFVDREQLLARKKATLLIRAVLRAGTSLTPLKLLDDVRLTITSTDLDGVSVSKEVKDLKLLDDRETSYEFLVPPRTAQITFQLKATIKNVTSNQKQDLATQETYSLNEIDRTDKTEDLFLARAAGEYTLYVLGKTGENRSAQAVQISFKHRDFREPLNIVLQSDARGALRLGALSEIDTLSATSPEGATHSWPLPHDQVQGLPELHGVAGQVLEVPYVGAFTKLDRAEFSLLETRGGTFSSDKFDLLKLDEGVLFVGPLPPGDYDLLCRSTNQHRLVKIVAGKAMDSFARGANRVLETRVLPSLSIASCEATDENIKIQLRNASKFARVHVIATRFVPAYRAFDHFTRIGSDGLASYVVPHAESVYLSGRNIGDEYRYILDRRFATKYPGNMAERPSLLLNPWAIRSTATTTLEAAAGEMFGAMGGGNAPAAMPPMPVVSEGNKNADFSDLDFLANTSVVLPNIALGDDGSVTIPRELLQGRQLLQVVAVDPESTVVRWVSLPEQKVEVVDRRLLVGLDPKLHFLQQKRVSYVPAGKELILPDIGGSRFEVYDSLARVYGLYTTLSNDAKLAEFQFIVGWNKLTEEQKREKYSKYACHELSFFLMKHDAEFFERVVVPYLQNKKDKTFLDQYLVSADLAPFRAPWQHERLNIVERILLGQRIANEMPFTRSQVRNLFSIAPVDLDRRTRLFHTAILSSSLESESLVRQVELRGLQEMDKLKAHAALDMDGAAPIEALGDFAERGAAAALGGAMPAADGEKQVDANRSVNGRAMKELSKSMKKDAAADAYYFRDAKGVEQLRRREARQLFRQVDTTQEWAENNYYHLPIEQQNADLVSVNAFWRDYALHTPGEPFFSENIAEASRSFTEMMLALSVLDLPFESSEHKTEFTGPQLKFSAGSSAIVFHEETTSVQEVDKASALIVNQNYVQPSDRFRVIDNEQVEKFVQGEFLINTVYGCQVVITNPSSSRKKIDVLVQIPIGALPVSSTIATKSTAVDLQPFATHRLEYFFYFPAPGKFAHFPAHVSINGTLAAFAKAETLNVVAEFSEIDKTSWEFVSQQGTAEQVLEFLRTENLYRVNLDRIAFRMVDAKFFQNTLEILTARHQYNHVLWSYAVKHNAPKAIAEFLLHANDFVNQSGPYLRSPLLTIDPVARHSYQHLEYKPLVNARAHMLGKRRQIVNDRFYAQYMQTLHVLSHHRNLSDDDLMAVTYYLLLQDRVEESLATFARVNADALSTHLQYDYCAAYLDLFREEPGIAAGIVEKYAEYPVDRWRNAFQAIGAQLQEIAGDKARMVDPEDRNQQTAQLAATDPTVDFRVEGSEVVLESQNLESVTVNYYVMDIELLFSRNPFVQDFGEQFSLVRPNVAERIALKRGERLKRFAIPKNLQTNNLLVEITGGGQTRVQPAFANMLSVQASENYAQVKVTEKKSGKSLPKTYVKVYAQMDDGSVKFFKDGYTDLRGRFDYGSLSTNELDNVKKFSLLVLSDDRGALIRELSPPKR